MPKPIVNPEDQVAILRNPAATKEEKEKAHQWLAINAWYDKYIKSHGREPNAWELKKFVQQLQERSWTILKENPDALVSLLQEEAEIRDIATAIAVKEAIDPSTFILYLLPSEGGKTIIQGATPTEIKLGFRKDSEDFKNHLRRVIVYASKLYRPSKLIKRSKLYEYKRDIKRLRLWDGVEYFPLVDESRLRVEEYRMIRVFDVITGTQSLRSEKCAEGMFSHYKSTVYDRLVMDGKIDISRQLIAKGLLNEEDDEIEATNND